MLLENPLVTLDDEVKPDVVTTLYGDLTFTASDKRVFTIKRVTLRTLPKVLDFVKGMVEGLHIQGGMPTIDLLNPSVLLQLIANKMDEAYEVVTLLSSASVDELLDMPMEDSLGLITKLVKENKSFFEQKIMPMVKQVS